MASSYKGKFIPKNPKKYLGDSSNIIYRSLWERKFMVYLDNHPDIIEWASEEFHIPYLNPIDNRIHRYFPDFLLKKRGKDGKIEVLVIEIKPSKQVKEPVINRRTKQKINEVLTYSINTNKWKAAEEFCRDRKWKFLILTEHELGIK